MIRPDKRNSSKKEKNSKNDIKESGGSFIASAVKGIGIGLGITCIVFVICALVLTYTDVSDAHIGIVSTVCTAVSALAAGFIWAAGRGKSGLITGILAGMVYCVVLLAVSLAAGGGPLSLGTLTCLVVSAAGGGIGGIFGVNVK
ncbi:MAG: TIGR04086 family membrane protein [Clostridiales bacterium]|nr:TIGR04086 family membrane protein [Clostridiales bacterium]